MKISAIRNYNINHNVNKRNNTQAKPSFSAHFIYKGKKENSDVIDTSHYPGAIESRLKGELDNLLIYIQPLDDTTQTLGDSVDRNAGCPGQMLLVGFWDGLKAREDILQDQEKFQTLPRPIIEEFKKYNQVLVDRISEGVVELEMVHYPVSETLEDFADRCAAKIREVSKIMPEIFLTKKIEVIPSGGIKRKDKESYTVGTQWESKEIRPERWFFYKYQDSIKPNRNDINIPVG